MKAAAKIKNLQSDIEKHIIIRNFSRILNIKIMDIDIETGVLSFVFEVEFTNNIYLFIPFLATPIKEPWF